VISWRRPDASPGSDSISLRVARVLAVVLASAAFQVVTQVLLARALTKSEVGLVSLVLGALPLLSTLSLVGQDSATVRFLSRPESSRYDVPAHVRRVLLLVLPAGAAVALAGAGYYSLSGVALAAVIVLVVSQNLVTVLTSALRAAHRYELAMAGMRMPAMAAGLILALLFGLHKMSLASSLGALIVAYGASSLVLTAGIAPSLPAGPERVPPNVVKSGLFFFGLSISFSVMIAVDKLIIGKLMSYADLAVYATVFAVMKAFDFLFYSLNYVLMPRVNAVKDLRLARLNAWIAGLAGVMFALYLLLGGRVVHILYGGRYDHGAYLILPFALSGVVKLFYSVPSSVIGGRLPENALRQFLTFNLFAMVLNVVLDVILIRTFGLLGAAVATVIAWGVRLLGGYAVIMSNRPQPR